MEDGNLASCSGVKKKQKCDGGKEEMVVGNRVPSQAEIDRKRQRDMAERSIRDCVSPHSLVRPYLPFGASEVEREVLEIHKERKAKAKKFLKDFDGKLTLSYDMLYYDGYYSYESVLHTDFVCMSAHFIDQNWKVRNLILRYLPFGFVDLEKVTVSLFKKVILDYEIDDKIYALLMPNNSGKAFDDLGKWIEERRNNPVNPRVLLIYCCSDLFRLMAGDVFDSMDLLLEDIRLLVGWGKLTSTNWNVTLSSLQGALDMEDKNVFEEDEYYEDFDKPSDEEWMMIRTFCKLGGCIYKVAKELFEGGYATSNVYFHLLAELEFMLNQELKNGDSDYFVDKAKEILKRFDKYWNDMFLVLGVASVLDPRFKMKYIEFYCSKNEVDNEGSKAEAVLEYLRNLFARYATSDIRPQPERKDAAVKRNFLGFMYCSEEEESEGEEKKKHDAYEDFVLFQEYLKFEGSSREFGESELDSYLKEPVVKCNKEFNALDWWRKESPKYPILSRVARDILSIPISRGKSYGAYVADKREPPESVISMEGKVVNAIMCSKSWSRL